MLCAQWQKTRHSDEGKSASALSRLTTIHICKTVADDTTLGRGRERERRKGKDIHRRCFEILMKLQQDKEEKPSKIKKLLFYLLFAFFYDF